MKNRREININLGIYPFVAVMVLTALKLSNTINWSWLVVTSPVWGGFALVFLIWIVVVVVALTANAITNRAWHRRY